MYHDPTRGRGRYKRGQETERKSFQFFVCKKRKIDMGNVWDGQSVVHAKGVTGERSDHTRSVAERGTSDFRLGSKSPKSRRYMFGKGGQGTAATLIPAKLSVRSGSDVTERSEESVRLGEQ